MCENMFETELVLAELREQMEKVMEDLRKTQRELESGKQRQKKTKYFEETLCSSHFKQIDEVKLLKEDKLPKIQEQKVSV